MRKSVIVLILLLQMSLMVSAQYSALKINMPSLALRNLSGIVEIGLNEKVSLNLGASYLIPYRNLKVDAGLAGFRSANSGFSITPELRFYLSESTPEGSGFYMGPYLRYSHYQAEFEGSYYDASLQQDADVAVKTSIGEFGAGLQIGYQFLLEEHFIIDLMIFGPRLSRYKFNAVLDADLGATEAFDALGIPQLDETGIFGFGSYKLKVSENQAELSLPLYFPTIRFGLALGYKF